MPSLLPLVIKNRLGSDLAVVRKASAGILHARRSVLQHLSGRPNGQTVMFILGCQRSGTTMLSQIFEGDERVTPFAEHSGLLSRHDHDFRVRDLSEIASIFAGMRGQLVVAKPLVESHRAVEILDFFPEAKALWVFRNYRDVVRSYVRLFDRAGINIMRGIVNRDKHWAAENVPEYAREVVEKYYHEGMSPCDAAALFWWIRNGWFFDLALEKHPRVKTCNYGLLVSQPDRMMHSIYDFLGLAYPGTHLVAGVHQDSRGLGNSVELDPAIEALCRERMERLCSINGDGWSNLKNDV